MANEKRKYPKEIRLIDECMETLVEFSDSQESTVRPFKMTGYTGAAVEREMGQMVIDVAGMAISKRLPILLSHDPTQIAGHALEVSKEGGNVKIKGLLSGDDAVVSKITSMSDKGFPWQASVGFDIKSVKSYGAGETVEVNGREFSGPIDVVKKSVLKEVSFCPIGADKNTSAMALCNESVGSVDVEEGGNEMAEDTKKAPDKTPVELERERFAALKAAFPKHLDFAASQFEAGSTVEQAKVAFCDVVASERDAAMQRVAALSAELEKAKADLAAAQSSAPAIPGAPAPVGFAAPATGAVNFNDKVKEVLSANPGMSQLDAMKKVNAENPDLYAKSVRA